MVLKGLYELEEAVREEDLAYIHRIDNTLFSHGGLTTAFAEDFLLGGFDDIDEIVREINEMGEDEMWTDDSPIWARPQDYDGYLDLCIVDPPSRWIFALGLICSKLGGRHTRFKGIQTVRCRKAALHLDAELPVHTDGEVLGDFTDLEFEILPSCLRLME